MLSTGAKFFTGISWTVVGMLIFFGFFLAALIWTFRIRHSEFYQKLARMPFEEGRE